MFIFAAEVFLSGAPGRQSYGSCCCLCLLFIEQLKHLGPWEACLPGVSPVSRQQITEGKRRVKVEELNCSTCHIADEWSESCVARTKTTNRYPDAWK